MMTGTKGTRSWLGGRRIEKTSKEGNQTKEEKKEKTYHPARKSKQHTQRIQAQHDHPSERGYEPPRHAQQRNDQQPDAEKDIIVRRRGGAAVDLGSDKVAREAEDEDGEEDLCMSRGR